MEKSKLIVLLDIDDTIFNTEKFKKSDFTQFELYKDVQKALEELSSIAMLGILSQGELTFQKRKLLETNIHHYFHESHTHIVDVKVEAFKKILADYSGKGKILFIEDRLKTLSQAKKTDPSIVAIWIQRGRYAHTQQTVPGFTPDYIISDLDELISIVKSFAQE